MAYPTQVALLDLLLVLYEEDEAPALLSMATPGSGWPNTTSSQGAMRPPATTPRAPPRSAPLLDDDDVAAEVLHVATIDHYTKASEREKKPTLLRRMGKLFSKSHAVSVH